MKALSDTERAVLETKYMRLHEVEARKWLKDHGLNISRATYFRKLRKLEDDKLDRLHYIAAVGFEEQHLERIGVVETCVKLMWDNYHKPENTAYQKVKILESIISAQPYLSSYYENSKEIMENIEDATKQTKDNKHVSER